MFVDLIFKFCCTKRQKFEGDTESRDRKPPEKCDEQQISPNNSEYRQQQITFTTYIDTHRSAAYQGQQDVKLTVETSRRPYQQNQQFHNQSNKNKLSTSIENNNENNDPDSPTDKFLLLGDTKLNHQGSFEEINIIPKIQIQQEYQYEQLCKTIHVQTNTNTNIMKRSSSTQTFEQTENTEKQKIINKKIKKEKISKNNNHHNHNNNINHSNSVTESEKQFRHVKIWEPQEDQLLLKYYKEYNGNWNKIAKMIPGRNMNQCAQRWRRITPQTSKQKWTLEDDQKIISEVQRIGRNWMEISKGFYGRTGKQIRERYLNKLDPQLRAGGWTKEEDSIILEIWKTEGPKWTLIANNLKGRSENMVKNRFYSYIKRVLLGQQNNYQVILNPGSQTSEQQWETNSTQSQYRVAPFSEKGSYSSGTTNFSIESMEDELDYTNNNELDLNHQFSNQCYITEDNGFYDQQSQDYYL